MPDLKRRPATRCAKALLIAAIASLATATSFGAVTVTARESGGDVVFTSSGNLNLTDAIFDNGTIGTVGGLNSPTVFIVGPAATVPVDSYQFASLTGPPAFGTGAPRLPATSGTGDVLGLNIDIELTANTEGSLLVPDGYQSGEPLSGSATFAGKSFDTLGLTPGTYTWSWGTGANADSVTLQIVPEPSAALLSLVGLLAASMTRRRPSCGSRAT